MLQHGEPWHSSRRMKADDLLKRSCVVESERCVPHRGLLVVREFVEPQGRMVRNLARWTFDQIRVGRRYSRSGGQLQGRDPLGGAPLFLLVVIRTLVNPCLRDLPAVFNNERPIVGDELVLVVQHQLHPCRANLALESDRLFLIRREDLDLRLLDTARELVHEKEIADRRFGRIGRPHRDPLHASASTRMSPSRNGVPVPGMSQAFSSALNGRTMFCARSGWKPTTTISACGPDVTMVPSSTPGAPCRTSMVSEREDGIPCGFDRGR